MSTRKVSLNKKHGFLIGIQRQLRQQAEELGIPPVKPADDASRPCSTGAADENSFDDAAPDTADTVTCTTPGTTSGSNTSAESKVK